MTEGAHASRFIQGAVPTTVPLVLLHGSGGTEDELPPLAVRLAPRSPALSLRGTVAIDGGFAFFHRLPDRSIDEADIAARVPVLADFITHAAARHAFARSPVAVGFSNGAIMVAALLLTRPTLLSGAILFRPLSPFRDDLPVRLDDIPVLIIDGEKDSRRAQGDGARLAERLVRTGAAVTHLVLPVGHAITASDEQFARDWLQRLE